MDIQGEICSIADLTALVQESEDGLVQPGVGPSSIWYRGQADVTWDVQPAVLRSDFVAAAERHAEAVKFKRGMKDQLMAPAFQLFRLKMKSARLLKSTSSIE